MISMARTKNVVTNGISSVSQGQCVMIATASAAEDIKNNNQYKPLDLRFTSMEINFCKNMGSQAIVTQSI
jgi:hypothetical protein